MKQKIEQLVIVVVALAAAAVAPNLFPAAQAGYAPLSQLTVRFLIPSVAVVLFTLFYASLRGYRDLARQIRNGLIAGLLGTIGLEIVRHTGFLLGGMPGEMPKLMGVLMLNRFSEGPNAASNLAGWSYHFWNGAAFGLIYNLAFGRASYWTEIAYALAISAGFMLSPVVQSLGVGYFGVDFGWKFPATVILAHLAFGAVMGLYLNRFNADAQSLLSRLREIAGK